jgi:tetratricopeptide (TPR) repeat protein
MMAGSVALSGGNHTIAETLFQRALSLETSANAPLRFVGALTMLGFVHTRRMEWDEARKCHSESINRLRGVDHIYRDIFTSLSACGLGEIELRSGQAEMALTRFRHALRLVKEQPRMAGNIRLRIRAQAGMAAAYAVQGEHRSSRQHLEEALSRLRGLDVSSWVFDLAAGQLHYSIASAHLRTNSPEEALHSLNAAIDAGFADAKWLATDPEWELLHDRADYLSVLERIRMIPPLNIDPGRFPSLDSPTGAFQSM